MRIFHFIVVAATLVFAAGSARAQDEDLERRTALARDLIAVSTGPNLTKVIELHVAAEIEKVSAGEDGEEVAWVRAHMPAMVVRMTTRLMADLAPVYADTFTVEELEAQLTFYRTPMGRQIAAKSVELGIAQQGVTQDAMMAFLTEFLTKYCAEFECGAAAGQTASKPSR